MSNQQSPSPALRRSDLSEVLPPRSAVAAREQVELRLAAEELEAERLAEFNHAKLDSLTVRRRLALRHPMLEQQYFIDTEETKAFYLVVFDHASARKSGLYVSGEYRVGKSTAIQESMRRLAIDLPHLGILDYSARRDPKLSKTGLCKDMLKWLRYPLSTRQDPKEVLVRLAMANAVKAGSRTCLFFIDEAQMLTVRQLTYFLEIWNELKREGFVLVTILVGQADPDGIESLRNLTEEEDHGAVIARFFVVPYRFGGLHTESQLEDYLAHYDERLTYPPSSNWTYSRYFLAQGFDSGWRLKAEGSTLWKIMVDYTGASKAALARGGFRLAFVNDTIHAFLIDAMENDRPNRRDLGRIWKSAVQSAGSDDLFIGTGAPPI